MEYGLTPPVIGIVFVSLLFVASLFWMVCWVIVAAIRRHKAKGQWDGKPHNGTLPPLFEKMVEKAMQERDAKLAGMEERIRVLEAIVIDNHKHQRLDAEFAKLKS